MIAFLKKEKTYFYTLSKSSRQLLKSFATYSIAGPLIDIFINAFLWKYLGGFETVLLHYIIWTAGMTIGFVVNGYLLQKASPLFLYGASSLIRVFWIGIIFLFTSYLDITSVLVIGFINCIFAGIYFANRNLLSIDVTKGEERVYFCTIESVLNIMFCVIIPLLFRWFIEYAHLISPISEAISYTILWLLIFVVSIYGAVILKNKGIHNSYKIPKEILLKKPSLQWKSARILTFYHGIYDGSLSLIPVLLILMYLGGESTIGFMSSICSILASILLYVTGKNEGFNTREQICGIGALSYIIGSLSLLFFPFELSIYVYVLLSGGTLPLIFTAVNPIMMNLIAKDAAAKNISNFSFVVDREIFLNAGRIVVILLLYILSKMISISQLIIYFPTSILFVHYFIMKFLYKINESSSEAGNA